MLRVGRNTAAGSQGPVLAAPEAPAFSLAPHPWEEGKLPLQPAHFPCKGGLGELLFAWTGCYGEQASPCPCCCPLSQRCRWAQGEARQALAGLGKSLGAGLGDKAGGGCRRGRWRRRQGCWLRPLRPAVNNGRRRRRQGEAPLLPPSLFRARGGGEADTRLPEAARPGAGPRDGFRHQPRSPPSAGGAGGAAAGDTGERPNFLPACPWLRWGGSPSRPRLPPAPGALPRCPPLAQNRGGGGAEP